MNLPWPDYLSDYTSSPAFTRVMDFVDTELAHGAIVYPPRDQIFAAFDHTPLESVRAVIIGQDPYHGPGQAMGLSFSVPAGIAIPPSLRNIYTELCDDLGCARPTSGDLTHWADQGVLLLNSVLTVRAGQPASHSRCGWQDFTNHVIQTISTHCPHVVFILWGNHAQKLIPLINTDKHLILTAPHPSPLSAYTGFFGSRPFSATNEFLIQHNITPIDWIRVR